jgi:kynurenine formamidase
VPLSDDLLALAARVSNRGRWGPDDQRGTLNLVTPDAVLRGVRAARQGRVFSLAIPMDEQGPQWDFDSMPGRLNPKVTPYAVNVAFTGDPRDFTTSDDTLTMGSQAATHWDALAHVGYDGLLYNGTPLDVVTPERGATRLGIEHFGAVATRGILVDVARQHGVERFDGNYAITAEDLDAGCVRAGVRPAAGDAVLVRTGQMAYWREGDRKRFSNPTPGLSTSTIEWFADHDVAAVATDTLPFEVYPCEDPAVLLPVHMIHLRDMGLAQGQLWDLDALAADSAADGQYDFLLVATPLPLIGAVGAPVAPTAIK